MEASADGTLLAGGYRNDVRRMRIDGRWVIVKRYAEAAGEPNPMYPNLPESEARALALLGPRGLAPELVSHTPGVLTYRYVPGHTWRPGRRASLAHMAGLLHRVHTVPVDEGFRDLLPHAAAARDHADGMLAATADGPEVTRVRTLRPADADAAADRPVLVHTDCGPGNVIRTRDRLVLIDWQCPGLGDPVEDLACVLSPAMMVLYACRPHSRAAVHAFLAAYPDAATVDRYRRTADAWHYRIAAYCAWRAVRLSTTDPAVAERYRRAIDAEATLRTWGAP